MSRIHIDDLPVAENLTAEQEALIEGAGLRSFRPSFEVLEGRDMPSSMSTFPQAPVSAANGKVQETGPQFFLTNSRAIADQGNINPDTPKLQLDRALPPSQTPIDLQRGSDSSGSSSRTPSRAEADSLFATRGIASAFRLEKNTRGADKIANFHVFAWGTFTTAGTGAPDLMDQMKRGVDLRATVERMLADPKTPLQVTAERAVPEADRR